VYSATHPAAFLEKEKTSPQGRRFAAADVEERLTVLDREATEDDGE
jgi:hypothetical protein